MCLFDHKSSVVVQPYLKDQLAMCVMWLIGEDGEGLAFSVIDMVVV